MCGCSDVPASRTGDSSASAGNLSQPQASSSVGTGWDSIAGPVVIVPGSKNSVNTAIVLPSLTDSTLASALHLDLRKLDGIGVDLFDLNGLIGHSILQVVMQSGDSTGCIAWPVGMFQGAVPAGWRVALESGRALGISLESPEHLSIADSAQFIADILGAVSSLKGSTDQTFRGIPFSVRMAYRLRTGSPSIIIAETVRKINEEANPREEHILLVAERSARDSTYRVAFHTRSAGTEESLETSEVLAALRFARTGRLAIFITFDYEDGGKIGLLERVTDNTWQAVWKSAYAGC